MSLWHCSSNAQRKHKTSVHRMWAVISLVLLSESEVELKLLFVKNFINFSSGQAFTEFLWLFDSTLLACTEACDNLIMHCVKKYLFSPPNLTPNNFSGCPVGFMWCDTVNSHYLVTSSAPFIVCSFTHLSFSYLETPHHLVFSYTETVSCLGPSSLLSSLLFNFCPPWGEKDQIAYRDLPSMDRFLSK